MTGTTLPVMNYPDILTLTNPTNEGTNYRRVGHAFTIIGLLDLDYWNFGILGHRNNWQPLFYSCCFGWVHPTPSYPICIQKVSQAMSWIVQRTRPTEVSPS